jgi:hypothetical protein
MEQAHASAATAKKQLKNQSSFAQSAKKAEGKCSAGKTVETKESKEKKHLDGH